MEFTICWHRQSWINQFTLIIYAIVTILISSQHQCHAQQQKFRVTPHDLQVLEGSEALMRCEVANLAGAVQWTKDGFALGFSAVIPGFPRYSVLGDRKQGVYNLRISNASIDDDAEYQCQVGPARLNSAIRANAKLTVISPPASIEIEGYASAARVEVRENQDLTLKCIVANAKPAAQIVWQRAGKEYKPESREDKVMESKAKRFTTTSRLELKPSSEDDYKNYTCQARHKALPPDMPMREHVQLSVLYPPGPPYIEGLTKEETLRRGQIVNLTCHSRGGNPPAQLIWYKNGAQVRMAYRTHGRISENTYTFTAESSDNKAKLRCEASNVMSPMALKTEMDLTVLFAPTHVTITAPNEARVGEVVPLTCTTAPSNPPAEIKWLIGNRSVHNATSRTVFSSEGGWSTSSNATTVIEPNKQSLIVICQSFNMQLTENVMSTHTINILHPPSPPVISGYVEGQIIPAGSVQKLACVSSGGNPLATLTWFKNDKRINSIVQTQTDSVSAEITILANVTDNQARYRCEAHNSATEIPLFESKVLSVHFAPETVKIHIKPEQLKPNTEATLICDSSSSNPPAKVSWWNQGILIQGVNSSSKQGLWGGTVSTLELKVNLTQEMNGVVYTCQSTNEALQRSVHEAITLDILYPPKFVPPPLSTVVGIEGESLQVALKANANPMSITYSWTKDGLPIKSNNGKALQRITSNNSVLNITKLHRNDAGLYKCEATNSQGTASIIITIAVQYGTVITSISENVVVNPGEDAMLSCTVDGSPLTEEHIKWERLVYDMTVKTSTSFANGTSFLHIKNAQRDDVGNFRCIADNRVGNPTNRDVLLIVKFAPEIDKSPTLLRAASGTGERGRIPCRAKAAPKPSFTWKMGGKDLPTGRTYKYEVEEKIIDSLTYESILIVDKVAPADYGAYECVAQNEIGVVEETVRLDITSPPDAPISLNILNVTHDSVILAWTPGFDGGLKATYRVRYREATKDQYRYIDALPNSHKLKIAGLRMNTLYLFSVMAQNDLGASKFLPDLTRAQTKEAPPPSAPASSLGGPPTTSSTPLGGTSGLLLLIGVIAGIVVVLLNIFIIGCCLHKRNQKRMKRGSDQAPAEIDEKSEIPKLVIIGIALAAFGLLLVNAALVAWFIIKKRKKEASNQNSKSATIEMYAPSSYNDTMTGETLSSVSEKSDSYSNEGSQPDYIDETRKKAASTYLVENPDMPPPRYQKDGTLPSLMYPNHSVNSRTLPHPRHNNQQTTNNDLRARDDQMLVTKGVYMPSPSPAPPMDGSYYNMNSDRYLSYPPLDYPTMEFTTPPLPMAHLQPNQTTVITSGGTLRRGIMRGVIGVPPPDVTHHTNNIPQASMLHDLHSNNLTTSSTQSNGSTQMTNLSGLSSHQTSTPKQPPQGILKDPKRNQMQLQQQQQQQLQQQQIPPQQQLITGIPVVGSANMQILNVTSAPGIGNSLLIGTYDPNAHNNLSTFNTSMGYTDADGHLV